MSLAILFHCLGILIFAIILLIQKLISFKESCSPLVQYFSLLWQIQELGLCHHQACFQLNFFLSLVKSLKSYLVPSGQVLVEFKSPLKG